MALSGMIRKASPSSVIPLALRAIGSSTTLNATTVPCFRPHQSHNFSSVAVAKDLIDTGLFNLLERECMFAKHIIKSTEVNTPQKLDSFPFKIEGTDQGNFRELTLRREFPDGELIEVEISFSEIDSTTEIESDDESTGSDDDKCEENIKAIPMSVSVTKDVRRDESLCFQITVSTKDIIIRSFCEGWPRSTPSTKFKDMNDEVQRAFIEYLNVRGVNSDIARFLLKNKYIDKETKKADFYALKHFKKIVKN